MKKVLKIIFLAALCILPVSCVIFAWDCDYENGDCISQAHFSAEDGIDISFYVFSEYNDSFEGPFTPTSIAYTDSFLSAGKVSADSIIREKVRVMWHRGYVVNYLLWLRDDMSIAAIWNLNANTPSENNRWLNPNAWTTDTVKKTVCDHNTITEYHHTFTFRPADTM